MFCAILMWRWGDVCAQQTRILEKELAEMIPDAPYGMVKDPTLIEKALSEYESFSLTQYYYRIDGSETLEMVVRDFRLNQPFYDQKKNDSFNLQDPEGNRFERTTTYKNYPVHQVFDKGHGRMAIFLGDYLLVEFNHTKTDTAFAGIFQILELMDLEKLKQKVREIDE